MAERAIEPPSDSSEPIEIRCEGSFATLNPGGTCPMCHAYFPGRLDAPTHVRPDIIAMLERGDYG